MSGVVTFSRAEEDMTCRCGFAYDSDVPEDRARHTELHASYERGPAMPDVDRRREVGRLNGLIVLESAPSDAQGHRRDFAELAMVAHREHPDFKAGYYGDPDEVTVDRRAYAVMREDRAIALAFTQREDRWWPAHWSGDSLYLDQREPETTPIRALQRVWVAASMRRNGLATGLIEVVATHHSCGAVIFVGKRPLRAADAGLRVRYVLGRSD